MAGRTSKLAPLSALVDMLEPGSGLALGGVLDANRPAAFVREVVRRRVGGLTLYSAPGSGWDADLLIGAGLVRRTVMPMVTMTPLGFAPCFRAAVEAGELEAPPIDAMSLVAGYLAAGQGHAFHLLGSVEGTDIATDPRLFETLTDSAGQEHRAVRAIAPDLCVLCVEEADEFGNVRHARGRVADLLMARASARTVVMAERIVPNATVRAEPARTTVPGHLVAAVVATPFGAHPTSTAGYGADYEHLKRYHRAAEARRGGESAEYEEYLRQFVTGPADEAAYREAVGGAATEARLREATTDD
ncbi:MAG TPA: CoA transferase [Solirubrobacterales bacterium]|nr:CoA transferase [Solirubrobacterales bacterium]